MKVIASVGRPKVVKLSASGGFAPYPRPGDVLLDSAGGSAPRTVA